MKRSVRMISILLLVAISILAAAPAVSAASVDTIDTSTAAQGYFTVNDQSGFTSIVKIGVTHNSVTRYYDYNNGTACTYAFENGNGTYTITVYHNISGKSYSTYASASVDVTLESEMAPYLISTTEVTFSATDAVGAKSAQLCKGLATDEAKVIAFYKFISANYKFNKSFANEITSGKVTAYLPDTARTLASNTGICYDLSSLFAALCRSQNIPCVITKGYAGKTYHAWNKVYVNGNWYAIDMTYALGRNLKSVTSIMKCVSRISTYSQESDSITTVKYAA
jgi:transglutaminase/protease-like cytokinesis protein 3